MVYIVKTYAVVINMLRLLGVDIFPVICVDVGPLLFYTVVAVNNYIQHDGW